jgi:quinolinate synthase
MPDEHLGRNTALSSGVPPDEIAPWNPLDPPDPGSLAHCRIAVWKGFCHVHTAFSQQDVDGVRARYPDSIVIVHPECPNEIAVKADSVGSTTGIIRAVKQIPPGKTIAIGTEWHLVNRLRQEFPEKTIFPLRDSVCHNMAVTRLQHLLHALDGILKDDPRNIIRVDPDERSWARLALEKMLKFA